MNIEYFKPFHDEDGVLFGDGRRGKGHHLPGSDDDREDDERNEEEDDEMDEEESGGKERDEADECVDRKKSAVYLHLLSRADCLSVYDDSHFSVLCRARYVQQLKVLEAVCIRIHKPVLCKQKEHVVALKLYS